VVDMVIDAEPACELAPVTITSGNADFRRERWHKHGGPWAFYVAKLHIIGSVQAALSSGRLKIAPRLAFAEVLRKELLGYRVKLTAAANETFEAREGTHDDLLLATAIAVWLGCEGYTPSYTLGPAVSVLDADLSALDPAFLVPPLQRPSALNARSSFRPVDRRRPLLGDEDRGIPPWFRRR
jgi:hypothetical protein